MTTKHSVGLILCLLTSACLHADADLSSTSTSTTADDTTGTSTGESSSTTNDSSTTTATPCDDDPACGPGETPETCPEQCSDCGDGILAPDEACDNGPQNQTYWPSLPPADACSDTCTKTLEYCGDAQQTQNEACDNGNNTDPPYAMTLPQDACAPGCKLPGYCGDAENTGEEACDDGQQTATCELNCTLPTCGDGITNTPAGEACDDNNKLDGDGCTADCKSIERTVFVTSTVFAGDLTKDENNPDALTGLALADFRCQTLAMNAGLTGTFKAWLSTTDESPSTRFDTTFTGLYRLKSADAPIVAMGWSGLTSGTLLHPIDSYETGMAVQDPRTSGPIPCPVAVPPRAPIAILGRRSTIWARILQPPSVNLRQPTTPGLTLNFLAHVRMPVGSIASKKLDHAFFNCITSVFVRLSAR